MQFNKASSSSSPAAAKASASAKKKEKEKEKRKEKFMEKIIRGNENTKSASFQKRLPTVKKKAKELQILCDVTVCVASTGLDGKVKILWPEEPEEVREAIESYRKAEHRNEMTVLEYLEGQGRKVEKRNLRTIGKGLLDWIDGLEGEDDLANVVAWIDEIEGKIRDLGVTSSMAEDRRKGKKVVTSSMEEGECRKGKRVVTSSMEEINGKVGNRVGRPAGEVSQLVPFAWANNGEFRQFHSSRKRSIHEEVAAGRVVFSASPSGEISNPSPLAWFPGNNGGCSQFDSREQSVYGKIDGLVGSKASPAGDVSQLAPVAWGGGYLQFSSKEQSIYGEIDGLVGSSSSPDGEVPQLAPVDWCNNGGYPQFPSSTKQSICEEVAGSGEVSNPSPIAWFPGNNGGNNQFPSIEQSIHGQTEDQFGSSVSHPLPWFQGNNGGNNQFPSIEQSIHGEIENQFRSSAPISWFNGENRQFPSSEKQSIYEVIDHRVDSAFPANNNGGYDQFPSTGAAGNDLYQGISTTGDEVLRSLFADTPANGFGAMGSDLYEGIPMRDEALKPPFTDMPESTLFHGYGGAGDLGLYETLPFSAWNPRQHQAGFGSGGGQSQRGGFNC
ncbi:Agamous-like MADS-box protein AGL103 [Linum perenne]